MMIRWTARRLALRHFVAAAILGGVGILGCGKQPAADESGQKANLASTPARAVDPGAPSASIPGGASGTPIQRDRLHQAFADAVRTGESPPADEPPPVNQTDTGKSSFKIMRQVSELWDTIRFTTPDGKKIEHTATLETDQGNIRIALFADLAPNHVRNFVALARAGYYDQLVFELVRNETGDQGTLRALEGGSPTGRTDPSNSSIGYWLKPEFQPSNKISHDEGIVGACRHSEEDSAACRFYINLTKAPWLDGNMTVFGKVVQGLDVVRTIYARGAIIEEDQPPAPPLLRPESPVVIKKVTIQTSEK